MAPTLSSTQTRVLFDFLGNHHKIPLLLSWVSVCVRAEEIKLDHSAFKQMRNEKVLPKRLGKQHSKDDTQEPFTAKEYQAISQLIKDTSTLKEAAFSRAKESWNALNRELTPLLVERPTLIENIKAFCNCKISKAKKEKLKNINHNLKSLIANSRWEQAMRPGSVVDMTRGKLKPDEKKLLSLGLKFSTGINSNTPLDVAKMVN